MAPCWGAWKPMAPEVIPGVDLEIHRNPLLVIAEIRIDFFMRAL